MLATIFQSPSLNAHKLELSYRLFYLRQDAKQATKIILAFIVVNCLFTINDFRFSGEDENNLFALLSLRFALLLFALIIAYILKTTRSVKVFDRLLFLWWAAISAMIIYIESSRPPSYLMHLLLDSLAVIAIYTTTSFRFQFQWLVAAILSISVMIMLVFLKPVEKPEVFMTALVALFLANIVGIAQSLQIHRFRRTHFKAMHSEKQLRKLMEHLAYTDDLTELNNRRNFFSLARVEMRKSKRHNRPLSLAALDLDHFKSINDTYGHKAGDITLRQVAKLLKAHCREEDIVARIGGEEFAILFPESSLESARQSVERLREQIEALTIEFDKHSFSLTISAGLTQMAEGDSTIDETLARADKALYDAKEGGRNRVVVTNPLNSTAVGVAK